MNLKLTFKKLTVISLLLMTSTKILAQRTGEDADFEGRMINESRNAGHIKLRNERKAEKIGGPENPAERDRIIDSLYRNKLLYKSQKSSNKREAAGGDVTPAPEPITTPLSFVNRKLEGYFQTNKINQNEDGVRLDRTVYNPDSNRIYALNEPGNLYDGKLVNNGSLVMRNHRIIINDKGFAGVKLPSGKFRLIAASSNYHNWTSSTFFFSDDEGLSWTESKNAYFSAKDVFWTDVMANGDIMCVVKRYVNDVNSYAVLRSTDYGVSYSVIKSWPATESSRYICTKLYNTDDHCILVRKMTGVDKSELYEYVNNEWVLLGNLFSNTTPRSITGTDLDGIKFYISVDQKGGFYSEDGTTFTSKPNLPIVLQTVAPYNASLIFSNEAQHDFSVDGGNTFVKYPNNNGTTGWDPKHLTFYKKNDGTWIFVIANDMGLTFNTSTTYPSAESSWKYVNKENTHAILHGGVADDISGLTITCHQDPGTFELTKTGDDTYLSVKKNGADGLRAAISNNGKAYWYRHYWDAFYHNHAAKTGDTRKASTNVLSDDWYTPPFVGSTKPNQDAIYVSGYAKLKRLTYNATNTITKIDLPYNFFIEAGDSTWGVAVAKSDYKRIYVATKNKRFFTSKDEGQTWTETTYSGSKPDPRTIYTYNQNSGYDIDVSDTDPDYVVWSGGSGANSILVSKDGGVTFKTMTKGMPTSERAINISLSPDHQLAFSGNFYFYTAKDSTWHSMKSTSVPSGTIVKSVQFLPTQNKVRYFTWGAGMLDFNITKIIGKDYFKFILVSGEVNSANNASSINWNVIEDENIAYYTVLRSTDSLNFVSIGNKTALANNLPTNNYQMPDSLKDITAPVAKIYYQIVSVYKDSSRVRSNTISMGGILGSLKLHFEEFSLSNKDNIVNIKWKAPNANLQSLTLQKSTDGENFVDVKTIINSSNTNLNSNVFTDKISNAANNETVYYRIVSKDANNQTQYSSILATQKLVITDLISLKTQKISLSPNPAKNYLDINLKNISSPFETSIVDILGKNHLVHKPTEIVKDEKYSLDISSLESGIYFLKLASKQTIFIKKFIKTKNN